MSLLILLLVVVVVVALAMWAVYYIPLPPGAPTFIKPMLYVIILLIGIVVILSRSGVVNAQQVASAEAHHASCQAQPCLR